MTTHTKTLFWQITAVFTIFLCAALANAQSAGDEPLAAASPTGTAATGTSVAAAREESLDVHAAQNPVATLISLPFQNNTYINYGPYRESANVLVVQPVLPFKLGDDWNLITRWVTPIIYRPRISPSDSSLAGIGNFQPELYFSPAHPGKVIWGVGPKLWFPTASDDTIGVNKWGGGPAVAALTIRGPWVVGTLVNNVWAGSGTQSVNQMTLNPFVDFNLPRHWYLVSAPIITADWHASADRWLVPVGLGLGRVFRIGVQPVNARVQILNNVVRPAYAPTWQLQFQMQLMFPALGQNKSHLRTKR
jgi:hypothetical protein